MAFSLDSPKWLLSTFGGKFSLQKHHLLNVSWGIWCPGGAGEGDCGFQTHGVDSVSRLNSKGSCNAVHAFFTVIPPLVWLFMTKMRKLSFREVNRLFAKAHLFAMCGQPSFHSLEIFLFMDSIGG
jgi:hypothetical protein